jgi:hypothetical protein
MITPEQQTAFAAELPEIFIPVPGGWGRGGATHVNLAVATEDVVLGALQAAHKLRVEKNAKTGSKPPAAKSKPTLAQKSKPVRKIRKKSKTGKTKPRRSNDRLHK